MTQKTELTQLELPGMPPSPNSAQIDAHIVTLAWSLIGVQQTLTSYIEQSLTLPNMDSLSSWGTLVTEEVLLSAFTETVKAHRNIFAALKMLTSISPDLQRTTWFDDALQDIAERLDNLALSLVR